RIDQGIAAHSYAHVVRADPARPGLLYAGTELGVSISFDDGDHWLSLQLNLPVASVRDLAVHDNDLVAATHGRAFWILDDLTPLRQLRDSVLHASAHLFAPERAIRVRRSVSNDTPLPPEEPHGENPPAGAVIDYVFQTAPPGSRAPGRWKSRRGGSSCRASTGCSSASRAARSRRRYAWGWIRECASPMRPSPGNSGWRSRSGTRWRSNRPSGTRCAACAS